MRQPDIDSTTTTILGQTTTLGPCFSCHHDSWFPQHPELIAACASDGLVYQNGIAAVGQNGSHAIFILSNAREQALRDFFLVTQANCP